MDGQPSLDRLELVQTFAFYEPKGREAIWRGFYDDVRGRIGQQDRLNRRAIEVRVVGADLRDVLGTTAIEVGGVDADVDATTSGIDEGQVRQYVVKRAVKDSDQ